MRWVRRSACEVYGLKDLNFFAGIKKQEEKQQLGKTMRNGLILLAVCAVVVAGISAWQVMQKHTAQAAYAQLDAEIEQMKTSSADYMALDQNKEKLTALKTYNAIIEMFTKNLSAYPHVDQALMDDIRSRLPEGASIQRLSYSNSVLKMECRANDTSAPADFVRSLRESARIADVSYNGYNAAQGPVVPDADGGTAPTGAITFTVNCALAGGGDAQ